MQDAMVAAVLELGRVGEGLGASALSVVGQREAARAAKEEVRDRIVVGCWLLCVYAWRCVCEDELDIQ